MTAKEYLRQLRRIDQHISSLMRERDELIEKRHIIITQINSLTDSRYVEILTKRYVEYKRFKRIAREMHYSEGRIKHLHGEALRAIQHTIALGGVV